MAFSSPVGFSLDQGRLDFSFAKREGWLSSEYLGHTVATTLMMYMGDPISGPMLFLSAIGPGPKDSKTPTHFHGSDQFRIILKGSEQAISRLTFGPGEFAYQEAGMPYKEGVGGGDEVWALLMMGDRRGAAATNPIDDDARPKTENGMADEQAAAAKVFAEMAKANPGGPAGIPSVATTLGSCRNGFLRGSFDASEGWRNLGDGVKAALGLWGDRAGGPVQLMIKGEAQAKVLPDFTCATETVFVVVSGTCRIGDTNVTVGDVRIEAADTTREAVTAGAEGVELILIVADRRALPLVGAADMPWRAALDSVVGELAFKPAMN